MAGEPNAPHKRDETISEEIEPEPVWSYRGYRLDNRDFTTSLVHLYRAEVTRANSWRSRLDVTTNWALLSTGAAVSLAFGSTDIHHSVILLELLLVTVFLFIESRRYRTFEVWSYRIRLIEVNYYSAMLTVPFQPSADWADKLAESLRHPRYPISQWEALGRRLRRNYIWIYLTLEIAWLSKLLLQAGTQLSPYELVRRSALGVVPGELVLLAVLAFDVGILALAVLTTRLRAGTDEVLEYGEAPGTGSTPPSA